MVVRKHRQFPDSARLTRKPEVEPHGDDAELLRGFTNFNGNVNAPPKEFDARATFRYPTPPVLVVTTLKFSSLMRLEVRGRPGYHSASLIRV